MKTDIPRTRMTIGRLRAPVTQAARITHGGDGGGGGGGGRWRQWRWRWRMSGSIRCPGRSGYKLRHVGRPAAWRLRPAAAASAGRGIRHRRVRRLARPIHTAGDGAGNGAWRRNGSRRGQTNAENPRRQTDATARRHTYTCTGSRVRYCVIPPASFQSGSA